MKTGKCYPCSLPINAHHKKNGKFLWHLHYNFKYQAHLKVNKTRLTDFKTF